MKIRIIDRILVALAGLLMLAACALMAAQLFFGKDVAAAVTGILKDNSVRVYLIIGLVLLTILGVYCLLLLFRHKGRKEKFIMQKTDNGELSISLKALESMIQKCLEPHKELTAQSVHLENQKGGLQVCIHGTVAGGVSIPLTVDALQQQIKQYVTACSGVEVREIKVLVETSGPDAKDALFAIAAPVAPALLSAAEKAETPAEGEDTEPGPIPPEEIEQVLAEMPAPHPSDAEDAPAPVTVPPAVAAAAEMLKSEAPPEEDDRPIHQRLFSSPEEPCVMPMPPETLEADAAGGKETESVPKEAEKPAEEPEKTAEPAEEPKKEKDEPAEEPKEEKNEPAEETAGEAEKPAEPLKGSED